MQILFIEDDALARSAGLQILDELELSYDTAETGEEALKLIEKKRYDVILCDLGLPDLTGFEITRRMHSKENPNKNTPIFALTAHDEAEYQKRILEAGMTGLLPKPLTKEI